MSDIKTAILETRPQFLILSLTLVMIGWSLALYDGFHNIFHTILVIIGLVAFHISVNVLNDYYDFKSGIDLLTIKTPFSGGTKLLPDRKISPQKVLKIGIVSLLVGSIIGIYFIIIRGWELIPILVIGIMAVCLYNPLLSKIMVGEIFAGLGLGLLPVIGIYFIFTGRFTATAVMAGMVPFFLTFNLLFLNEFPDTEADKEGGRRHLVILLGKERAGVLYSIITSFVYLWIVGGIIAQTFPLWSILAILTLPMGIKAIKGALLDYDKFEEFVKAQGANVFVVLVTQALFAAGFIISTFVK